MWLYADSLNPGEVYFHFGDSAMYRLPEAEQKGWALRTGKVLWTVLGPSSGLTRGTLCFADYIPGEGMSSQNLKPFDMHLDSLRKIVFPSGKDFSSSQTD